MYRLPDPNVSVVHVVEESTNFNSTDMSADHSFIRKCPNKTRLIDGVSGTISPVQQSIC